MFNLGDREDIFFFYIGLQWGKGKYLIYFIWIPILIISMLQNSFRTRWGNIRANSCLHALPFIIQYCFVFQWLVHSIYIYNIIWNEINEVIFLIYILFYSFSFLFIIFLPNRPRERCPSITTTSISYCLRTLPEVPHLTHQVSLFLFSLVLSTLPHEYN